MSSVRQQQKQCSTTDEVYRGFIEENQKLLNEVSELKGQIKLLEWELRQYQNLSSKIVAIIRSRENFGIKTF